MNQPKGYMYSETISKHLVEITDNTQKSLSSEIIAPKPRVKVIRVVVEMTPEEHRNLRRMSEHYAEEIGATQVAMSEVLRALHELAQSDQYISMKLGIELKRTGGTRRPLRD